MELRVEQILVDPERIPDPVGWRILVEPIRVLAATESGIQLPDQTVKAQEYLRYVGQVIAIGPDAYKHDKFQSQWIKAGDWVAFSQYEGQEIRVKGETEDGRPGVAVYRLINDDSILARINDPESVLIPY
jgi:co-chaperonin GroES (HSP10)